MDMDGPTMVKIKTITDNQEIEIDQEILMQAEYFKNCLEDSTETIKVPKYNMHIIKKIIKYCEYHLDKEAKPIPQPLKSNDLTGVVDPWDAKFIDLKNIEDIFDIILASDFLVVPSLFKLACAKIASLAYGNDVHQMRKTFNLENDFTSQEEAKLKKQYEWVHNQ